jgi:hypothetical protein
MALRRQFPSEIPFDSGPPTMIRHVFSATTGMPVVAGGSAGARDLECAAARRVAANSWSPKTVPIGQGWGIIRRRIGDTSERR